MAFYHTEAGTSFVPKKKCFAKVGKIIEEKKNSKGVDKLYGFSEIFRADFRIRILLKF